MWVLIISHDLTNSLIYSFASILTHLYTGTNTGMGYVFKLWLWLWLRVMSMIVVLVVVGDCGYGLWSWVLLKNYDCVWDYGLGSGLRL